MKVDGRPAATRCGALPRERPPSADGSTYLGGVTIAHGPDGVGGSGFGLELAWGERSRPYAGRESGSSGPAAPHVRSWRSERLDSTGAETTVAKSYRLLKAILETAVEDELIRRNPCRIRGAGKETAAERPVATVDQVDALADALGPRWRLMVYLGAYGPLRPEEQAELRRKDVDLENLTIRVRQAAPELTTGKRAEGSTKSEAASGSSSCRPFCGPTFVGISTGTRRRARTDSCSWGRRASRSGAPPSGGSGVPPVRRWVSPTASASTTFVTPGTP